MILVRPLFAVAFYLISTIAAPAHEFWIEPLDYAIAGTDSLNADLRNGQKFSGAVIPLIPNTTARFEVISGDAMVPVGGRLGDRPALKDIPAPDGLAVLVYQSTSSGLVYDAWEKFTAFVAHKDLAGVLEAHKARGLPETGFREDYIRYSKALVSVGSGRGADRPTGLRTEIVALANPYTDDLGAGLPLQVLYEGAPRPDAQVELFERAPDGSVAIQTYRTDATGTAVVPVRAGHVYLADAVVMNPLDAADGSGAVWQSLWAALTFAVPD